MSEGPRFSIVIPVYNRPREILRALKSCLDQVYRDFEVLVVDDASTDQTYAAVTGCPDGRVSVLRHIRNRGVCAARNSGVRHARGEWVVFLDSDDEFLPGALETMAERTRTLDPSIHRVGFRYVHPDGQMSPAPAGETVILDYPGYLRWAENATRSDFNNCVRRSTFKTVRLPEGRVYERLYHLEFAHRFNTLLAADTVARVHNDAANRLTNIPLRSFIRKKRAESGEGERGVNDILERHGAALQRFAPNTFRSLLRQRVELLLISGQWRRGLKRGVELVRTYPRKVSCWATLATGLLGPGPLAALTYFKVRAGN